MTETSVQTHRYAGFFHFRDLESIPVLVQWLRGRSTEFVASLEKMGSSNPSDRHIQWAIKTPRPWTRSDTAVFTDKGAMGKYLVAEKHANVGCKHSKRWSKIDAVVKNYDWRSSLIYVGKDVTDIEGNIWWEKDGTVMDCTSIIGQFVRQGVQNGSRPAAKTRVFFDVCCEWYETTDRPSDLMEICEGLCRRGMFGKWSHCDPRSIVKMAEALRAKYHNDGFTYSMMNRIRDLNY